MQNFETAAKDVLTGATQKAALDFAAYLKSDEAVAEGEGGQVTYKGKTLCYMHVGGDEEPGPWTVWTEGEYSDPAVALTPHMKEIAWSKANVCGRCGGSCAPGQRKTIFGKAFDNICNADMAFYMPNAEEVACLEKLMDMRKLAIDAELTA